MTKTLAISGLVFLTNTAAAHAAVIYRMDSITTVGAGLFDNLVHRTSCLGPEDRYVATRRAAALRVMYDVVFLVPGSFTSTALDRGAERDIGRGERHQRPVPPDHSRQRHRFQPANGDQRRRELCDQRGHLPGSLSVNVECDHPRRAVGAGPEGRAGHPFEQHTRGELRHDRSARSRPRAGDPRPRTGDARAARGRTSRGRQVGQATPDHGTAAVNGGICVCFG